ncbi:MAG: DUF2332 family protein [Pseudomonadota bacterium]
MPEAAVRRAFADQADWCDRLGSPFTARLLAGLGRALGRETETGRRVLDWPGPPDAMGDSVPLRLAGALHGLVRAGRLEAFRAYYPPAPLAEEAALTAAALEAIAQADAAILGWLERAPQTNEVARSGVLYPGFAAVAAETGLPLALHELGASAGLNLVPDRYAYRLGGATFGAAGAPVRLQPDWTGPAPAGVEPRIVTRRGCDLARIDLRDMGAQARLISYIWPDQPERLARAAAAIGLFAADPATPERADAADWTERVFAGPGPEGVVRVLFHSIAFQYFPEAAQRRIGAAMAAAGAAATPERPVAWLAFEQRGDTGPHLTLRLWPGGAERRLARADAHVRRVHWLA